MFRFVMKRRGLSLLCISLVMCVIIGLQLANHFVMFQKTECVCNCDSGDAADRGRQPRAAATELNVAANAPRTFDGYVERLLDILGKMNGEQKAELGASFEQLDAVLSGIKNSRLEVKSSRKLSEKSAAPGETDSERATVEVAGAEVQEICPEKFLGKHLNYGYPFFRKGFGTVECSQFVPVKDLVTVVFDDLRTAAMQPPAYRRVLEGLAKYHPDVNVVYITNKELPSEVINKMKSKVKLVRVDGATKLGRMWSDALTHVSTKYVLIAPNLVEFDDDVNLKRLLRILSHNPDVVLASAAYRKRNGHWDIGCEQTIFRNFTLTLQGGYYLSFWECVVCDYAPGPFVARTGELKKLGFEERFVSLFYYCITFSCTVYIPALYMLLFFSFCTVLH